MSQKGCCVTGIGNHFESSQAQPLYPLLPNQTNHYNYDSDNRLTLVDGKTVTHDNNGNLTGIGGETFSYDFENRLVQYSLTNSTGACLYDGAGNRLVAVTNGVTHRFVLDRLGALTQVLVETDTNGVVLARYVFGLGLAQRITPDGTVSTYLFDVRGSTVAMTDTAGNVTDGYAYDSFGVLANQDGDCPQSFRYLGRHGIMDDSSGLCYARARHFSPQLGRFLSKDPMTGRDGDGQSLNRYVYALNNPVRLVDVSGLSAQDKLFSVIGNSIQGLFLPEQFEALMGPTALSTPAFVRASESWSVSDFLYHYYFGNGQAVDLANIGLLDQFRSTASVRFAVEEFKRQIQSSLNPDQATFTLEDPTITNVTWDNQSLFSVGHSTFYRSTSCDVQGSVASCNATFEIRDWFTDIFDLRNLRLPEYDPPGSSKYRINASWNEQFQILVP